MSEDEFWRLTAAKWWALCEAERLHEKGADARAGVLATVMRRIVGDKRAEIWDFFPELKEDGVGRRSSSTAQIRANLAALKASQNGGKAK